MTLDPNNVTLVKQISTHTLTWSVTLAMLNGVELNEDFNSHAHVERDTSVTVTDDSTGNFNSHAHVERD